MDLLNRKPVESPELQKEYDDLMSQAGGLSNSDRLRALAVYEVIRKREDLRDSAAALEDDMRLLVARIERDEDASVNSLGEVQSRALAVDLKCAELTQAKDWLTRVRRYA